MNNQVDSTMDKSNVTAKLVYYAVFCTYRRKKVFCERTLIERLTELVNTYLEEMNCELLSLVVFEDHVKLSIVGNPALSPLSIFYAIRHNSSGILRQEVEELKNCGALWSRGLLLSTSDIGQEEYMSFLLGQKRVKSSAKNKN